MKNSITGETIYTPPQSEQEIRGYLKNLEDFINNNKDGHRSINKSLFSTLSITKDYNNNEYNIDINKKRYINEY